MLTITEILLFIVLPSILLCISIFIMYLIYKKCIRSGNNEEDIMLLSSRNIHNDQIKDEDEISITKYNNMIRADVGLVDKVKYEQTVKQSSLKEASFVYLQFFMRSNASKGYSLIEHLNNFGRNTEKNWVHIYFY